MRLFIDLPRNIIVSSKAVLTSSTTRYSCFPPLLAVMAGFVFIYKIKEFTQTGEERKKEGKKKKREGGRGKERGRREERRKKEEEGGRKRGGEKKKVLSPNSNLSLPSSSRVKCETSSPKTTTTSPENAARIWSR